MTAATPTPFVNTPFGVGVVEIFDHLQGQCYIRFQDGSRGWAPIGFCELNAERPDWYRELELCDLPGTVA